MCCPACLDECARMWYNQFKGTDSVENLNSQDAQDPLTKSLAMIAIDILAHLRGFLRCCSCGELQLEFITEMVRQKCGFFFTVVSFICTP